MGYGRTLKKSNKKEFIMHRLMSILCIALMLSIGSVACKNQGNQSSKAAPEPGSEKTQKSEPYRVEVTNFSFSPETLEVPVGSEVTWINQDDATHTVTSDERIFDSDRLAKGETFSYTFEQEGTYPYHCALHSSMKGKIIVKEGM
jgi:plastocyanin